MRDLTKVRIVADSSADIRELPPIPFASAPLRIRTAEREFLDDATLDVREMVTYLRGYRGKSSTSCPNVGDWLAAFGDAEEVFCVTITATLSGSYNAAVLAGREYMEAHPGRRVHVINSLTTGPEMKLLMERIAADLQGGMSFDEIVADSEAYLGTTGLLFVLESLKNLANNGRVSPLAANVAGLLGIRVIGRASDRGDLEQLDKVRGAQNAVRTVKERLISLGYAGGKLRISHCLNEAVACRLAEEMRAAFAGAEIEVYPTAGLCAFYAEMGGLLIGFEKGER